MNSEGAEGRGSNNMDTSKIANNCGFSFFGEVSCFSSIYYFQFFGFILQTVLIVYKCLHPAYFLKDIRFLFFCYISSIKILLH